ncbi:MAG: ABC transporter permease, partial [Phycisphaerae bacterium]
RPAGGVPAPPPNVTGEAMENVLTMAQRELGAYFLSPIAYVVNAIFLFTAGLVFALGVFQPGEEASLRFLFDFWLVLILMLVMPMLTMRLVSEEFRTGTIETLMTAPITEIEVVIGKFFAALGFFFALLATLLLYPIILSLYGQVDFTLMICNFMGLVLLGSVYIAIGLFFSACTKHQVVAVLLTVGVLAFMTFAFGPLAQLAEGVPRVVLQQLSIRSHFHDFVRGLVDVNHFVFFLSTTGLFLFLTVKRLEMRRWQ